MRIFVSFLSELDALYRDLTGGGGGGIVTTQTIRRAPDYERAQHAAGARRGAGPRPRCPLPLAPGGALLALRDVGVDVRVELVGAPLQRVSLLALLLGLGLALLRCEMLLLRMGGLLVGGRALPLGGERLRFRLAAVLSGLVPLLGDPAGPRPTGAGAAAP